MKAVDESEAADWQRKQCVRDRIILLVSRGRMSPEKANAIAARRELGPFERQPDPAQFDPMRQPWWTLAMAVAWISRRTTVAVRDCMPEYVAGFLDWAGTGRYVIGNPPREHWGFELKQRDPPSLFKLMLGEAFDEGESCVLTLKESRLELRQALAGAKVTASACQQGGIQRSRIDALEWIDSGLASDSEFRDVFRTGDGTRQDNILIEAAGVLREWLAPRAVLVEAHTVAVMTRFKGLSGII